METGSLKKQGESIFESTTKQWMKQKEFFHLDVYGENNTTFQMRKGWVLTNFVVNQQLRQTKRKAETIDIEQTHDTDVFIVASSKSAKDCLNEKYNGTRSDLRKEGKKAASKAREAEIRACILIEQDNSTEIHANTDTNNAGTRNNVDGRINNRGSSVRNRYSARDVVDFVDMVDSAIEEGRASNVSDVF